MKLSALRIDMEMPIEAEPRTPDAHYIHLSDEVHFDLDGILQPNSSITTRIRFYYKADPPFDPPGSVQFIIRYYDPRAHKTLLIKQRQKFRLKLTFR